MDRLGLVGLGGGKACDIVGRITVVILDWLVIGHWPKLLSLSLIILIITMVSCDQNVVLQLLRGTGYTAYA